jgi:hypothetical protein
MGHYVGGIATSSQVYEFTSQFERRFSLIVCWSTAETPSNILYIESGSSSHMSGVREHFTDLIELWVKLEIMI